jgi:hypothetical protein
MCRIINDLESINFGNFNIFEYQLNSNQCNISIRYVIQLENGAKILYPHYTDKAYVASKFIERSKRIDFSNIIVSVMSTHIKEDTVASFNELYNIVNRKHYKLLALNTNPCQYLPFAKDYTKLINYNNRKCPSQLAKVALADYKELLGL